MHEYDSVSSPCSQRVERFVCSFGARNVGCVGEGHTREEAIARAKAALEERLARGEIVTIDVESNDMVSASNVWREQAVRFHDDPTFDEFVAEIQSERRDMDSEKSAS